MNTQNMIAVLTRKELDPLLADDYRRLLRDERLTIMSRLQRKDHDGARRAVAEAQRVIRMWEGV